MTPSDNHQSQKPTGQNLSLDVPGLMQAVEDRRGLSLAEGLKLPLNMQYHTPGGWLMFTFGKGRAFHIGSFYAGSLTTMAMAAERLELVWNAAQGKSNDELRAEIAAITNPSSHKGQDND